MFVFAVKDNKLVGIKNGKFVGFIHANNFQDARIIAKSLSSDYEVFGKACSLINPQMKYEKKDSIKNNFKQPKRIKWR